MASKRSIQQSEAAGAPSSLDSTRTPKRKRISNLQYRASTGSIEDDTRPSQRKSNRNDAQQQASLTPKNKQTPRKRASTARKETNADIRSQSANAGAHRPIHLRRSVVEMSDSEDSESGDQRDSVHSEQDRPTTTPSRKRKVVRKTPSTARKASKSRVDDSPEFSPKEPRRNPRRKSATIAKSPVEEPSQRAETEEPESEADEHVIQQELLLDEQRAESPASENASEEASEGADEPSAGHLSKDAEGPTEKKTRTRRSRKPQPWSVPKHVIMSRNLLRDARAVNLDPKLRRLLRQTLDMQKETKIAFQEIAKSTNYSWIVYPQLGSEARDAICEDIFELAGQSNLPTNIRDAVRKSLEAFKAVQAKIDSTNTKKAPQVSLEIEEIFSQAATMKAHTKLAKEALKNALRQGQKIKMRHIHDEPWELHSKEYVKVWETVKDTHKWQVPLLLFARRDCPRANGQRAHKCHVAGLLIGNQEFESRCTQITKEASLTPVELPLQAGRYVEGEEDACKISCSFFGQGWMKVRLPRKLIERPLLGEVSGKGEEIVDFYGVQIRHATQ